MTRISLSRRKFLGAGCALELATWPALLPAFLPGAARAAGMTGIDAIDTASLMVVRPTKVFLVAITRAGNRLLAMGEHGVIIFSDDEGTSWTQARVPVNVTVTCMAFINPEQGWAAGAFGVILHTQDGGMTWERQLDGMQANQIMLTAAENTGSYDASLPGAPLAIRRANYLSKSGPSTPFLSVLVLSPAKIIVFGAFKMTMMTMDGGVTWQDWSLHIYDRLSHDLYSAVMQGDNIYVVGEAGLVFCSTDGGNNFRPLTPAGSVTLFGIFVTPQGNLIVFGVAGNCFRSADGGQSWSASKLAITGNLIAGGVLQTKDILIISQEGEFLTSRDDGVSFNVVTSLPNTSIFDFEQLASGDLILTSDTGIIHMPQRFE